jgi:catechol 2,3-dioxygenase-like lactoylglutathione lyase family enzyme
MHPTVLPHWRPKTARSNLSAMVLGHLGLNVPDLASAKAHYDAVMPALGFESFLTAPDEFAYRPANGKVGTYVFFYPSLAAGDYSRQRSGLQHLGFMMSTRTEVRDVHTLVQDLGCEVLHEPQDFPQYGSSYYATFWLDPFGFMVEAVCHHDRD